MRVSECPNCTLRCVTAQRPAHQWHVRTHLPCDELQPSLKTVALAAGWCVFPPGLLSRVRSRRTSDAPLQRSPARRRCLARRGRKALVHICDKRSLGEEGEGSGGGRTDSARIAWFQQGSSEKKTGPFFKNSARQTNAPVRALQSFVFPDTPVPLPGFGSATVE